MPDDALFALDAAFRSPDDEKNVLDRDKNLTVTDIYLLNDDKNALDCLSDVLDDDKNLPFFPIYDFCVKPESL